MIVSEVMTTRLVTVAPDDTLSHAANLLRQYQFHHLPVVRGGPMYFGMLDTTKMERPVLEGLLTSEDIDMAQAIGRSSSDILHHPWQERRVVEVMHPATIRVTPTTSVAAAAQLMVERGLNSLPVVEYESAEQPGADASQGAPTSPSGATGQEAAVQKPAQALLVGLVTRSDLLMALARALGALEPGMQIAIALPMGDLAPLATALQLAADLHIQVRSVLAAPLEGPVPLAATIRLGTIHPAPLLVRLQEAGIQYTFAEVENLPS